MRILIDENAAAFARPGTSPAALVVVRLRTVPVGDYPYYAFEIAQPSAFDDLFSLFIDFVRALIVKQTELELRLCLSELSRFSYRLRINARGLVAKHVESRFESVDSDGRMRVVRSVDNDCVDEFACQHFLVIAEDLYARESRFSPLSAVFRNIAYRDQLTVLVHAFEKSLSVVASLFADTYDTVSDLIHYLFSFSTSSIISLSPLYCHVKMSFLVTLCIGEMPFAALMRLNTLFQFPT